LENDENFVMLESRFCHLLFIRFHTINLERIFYNKEGVMAYDNANHAFLPTGFDPLNHILAGGYPIGAITALTGNTHAIKTVTLVARTVAARQGWFTAYLRVIEMDNHSDPAFSLRLWSMVSMLFMQGTEMIVVEGATPSHLYTLPRSLSGLVQRRNRLLLVTISQPTCRRTALSLNFTPKGWLYRRQQVYAYRTMVTVRASRFTLPCKTITLEIPVPSHGGLS
jgi:hypothetical protein